MNSERYQEMLEHHLIPFMGIHGSTHFLQDGAPCHSSKKISNFLAEQPFQVIDWPGNSSDLNPIENCWSHMKRKLKDKDISSVPKLIAEIKMLWTCNLSRKFFKNLSDSMPRRIQQVLAAKGEAAKY
jgi:transposase